jgi:hypothetical protein
MKGKKIYSAPTFLEIILDEEISLLMTSEDTKPVDPGGQEPLSFPAQGSSTFKSEDTNKGFDENPFRE